MLGLNDRLAADFARIEADWRQFCIIILGSAALAACQTTAPVDRPCGIIADSLKDVRGARPVDRQRIDVHFERGVAAGCWPR